MRIKPIEGLLYHWLKVKKAGDKRPRRLEDFDPGKVKNILVVSCTAIGDTLLSTPAIRAVRKRYPNARITALLNKDNKELFANNPHIDSVVPFNGGYNGFFSTLSELRRSGFDLALILHGNEPQATPLCYLSGAQFIFKLPNESKYRFLLSNTDPVVGWDALGHGIEARLSTAALAGCASDGMRMELFIDKADAEAAERFLIGEGVAKGDILVGFQPGASTTSRKWFPERFIELGWRLKDYPGARVVVTGSPGERALCDEIASGIGGDVINAAGRLPLVQVAPLIERLDAFVTGDTGPMHIAVTMGTPVVALYAVADARKTGPLYDKEIHSVIQKPRCCDPCVSKKCIYQECMEAITVDEVELALRGVLGAAYR